MIWRLIKVKNQWCASGIEYIIQECKHIPIHILSNNYAFDRHNAAASRLVGELLIQYAKELRVTASFDFKSRLRTTAKALLMDVLRH
jgi:hypothetical protein